MQEVYSHFQERIPSNSSIFSIPNPNRYRDGIPRTFSLKYIHIVPEYFSMLATQNSLDNEELNPIVTKHNFKFEINFKPKYYAKADLFEHSVAEGTYVLTDLLKELNTAIDRARPNSMSYPPVVFDWIDEYLVGYPKITKDIIDRYFLEAQELVYKMEVGADGEEKNTYKEATHANVLPASARSMPNCNNYLFPDEPEAIVESRVRMIIAPNTKVSLSNESLLAALGFTPKAYGQRGALQRFHIVNKNPDMCLEVIAAKPPPQDLKIAVGKASKFYISVAFPTIVFSKVLTTTKFKEKRPEMLFKDMEGFLKSVSSDCYIAFKIQYTAKRFTFTLVDDDFITTKIYIPPSIQEYLGFSNTVTSTNKISSAIDPTDLDMTKYLGLSKVLTYDTCHVIVTVASIPSMTNIGQGEQIMAALVPKDDMLKMVKGVSPKVIFPENEQTLIFKIYRQSEAKKMIQLGWPIDCYVYGMLAGEPIKM
jgi:hypothetical protein